VIGNNRHGIVLQDRDRKLLAELSVMRVIDREQAKRIAGFGSTTRANIRLLRLTRAGLLRRFFLGTVGGARKGLYALSPHSAKLLDVPYRGPRRGQDQTVVADFFVLHQLRINDIYCTVKCNPLPEGAAFVRWLSFHEPLSKDAALIPDGYAEIAVPDGTFCAFLEVDRGHESRSVWQRKVTAYLNFAVSGAFDRQFHQPRFRTSLGNLSVGSVHCGLQPLQSPQKFFGSLRSRQFNATDSGLQFGRGQRMTSFSLSCPDEILLPMQSNHGWYAALL